MSRPTRPIPIACRLRRGNRRPAGPRPRAHAAVREHHLHLDRAVDRARRRRHRIERHRRHAGQPRDAGDHRSVLRVSRSAQRSHRPTRTLPDARRPARPPRRDARRHHRLRNPARRRRATMASSRCPTKTTCIPIPISWSAASTRCCSTTSSRSDAQKIGGFAIQPASVAVGHYVGVLAPANTALRDRINELLRAAMRDGSLERILRKWNVWNDDQPELHRQVLAGESIPPTVGAGTAPSAAVDAAAGSGAPLPAVAAAGLGGHDRSVVPVDGARRRPRRRSSRPGASTATAPLRRRWPAMSS